MSPTGVDGVLGIGHVVSTEYTVAGLPAVLTVTDNFYSQGIMFQIVVSLFFEPITSASDTNGEPIFSSIDDTKYTDPIAYT